MKNFFFNKVEKNIDTNFTQLIISLSLGGLKIFILFMLIGIISGLRHLYDFKSDDKLFYSIISFSTTILFFIYIVFNRIPNQSIVFSNYLKSNKLKKIEIKNQNIKTPIIETNNLLNNNSNMSHKFIFSKAEKRTVIVLMLINSFALFVNYFGLSYRIDKTADLFTNSTGIKGNYYHYPYDVGYSNNSNHFYPLVDFTSNNYPEGFFFKGIFAYYDTTEFIVYTLLIFGFVVIKKIW